MSDPASYRKRQLEKSVWPTISGGRALTREEKLTNGSRPEDKSERGALASVKFAEESPEPPLENVRYT